MTITKYEFDRYINGHLMAEGVTVEKQATLEAATAAAARIASKGPKGEAPVLVLRREPAAIEAPAQKPVAWRVRERPGFNWRFIDGDPDRDPTLRGHERQPLYTSPPDHLALVAAAYRDAEDKARYDYREWDNATPIECDATACEYVADAIRKLTPADAEAHLTALLRAEYERGVREAALKAYQWGDADDGQEMHDRILALLTQEGR